MSNDELAKAMERIEEFRTEATLLLIIPREAQAATRFDQTKLGVLSAFTDNSGTSWIIIDPERFSEAFPHE